MVKKLLLNMIIDAITVASKSAISAYKQVVQGKNFHIFYFKNPPNLTYVSHSLSFSGLLCLEQAKKTGQAAGGAAGGSKAFDQMKEQMGAMVQNPMTRDEALQILNIEEEETDPAGPEDIMKRFDILMEKNT